jgi:hypothetical protein
MQFQLITAEGYKSLDRKIAKSIKSISERARQMAQTCGEREAEKWALDAIEAAAVNIVRHAVAARVG